MAEFITCLNTSTIRTTPLLETIRIAGAVGYDAIEPWNDEVSDYINRGGNLTDLRKAIDDAGLKVVSMIALGGWINADGEEYRRILNDCRNRFEQAAALGAPFIVASPPEGAVDLDRAAERYGELIRIGRDYGVRPSMEFLGFVEGVHSLESARAIADGSGEPEASIVADIFHLLRGGGSIDDLLQINGSQVSIFHVNDLPASPPLQEQTDADRVMLGDGTADLPRVIANLRAIGYTGPLSLELFNPTLWRRNPASVAQLGLERLRAWIDGSQGTIV